MKLTWGIPTLDPVNTSDIQLITSNSRLSTPDFWLLTLGIWLPIMDFRLPPPHFQLLPHNSRLSLSTPDFPLLTPNSWQPTQDLWLATRIFKVLDFCYLTWNIDILQPATWKLAASGFYPSAHSLLDSRLHVSTLDFGLPTTDGRKSGSRDRSLEVPKLVSCESFIKCQKVI